MAVIQWRDSPWFVMFASILVMASSAGAYVFGCYSPALRASLGYSQTTLNNLSFWKNLGGCVGILPGMLYKLVPTRVILLIGAVLNLGGYLPIYLTVTGHIAPLPPVWAMALCIAVGAASQTFATTAAVVSTVKSFPDNRGVVLGLLMCFGSLSGAIFTQLHQGLDDGDEAAGLVLVLALLPTVVSLIFTFTIPENPADLPVEVRRWGFRYLLGTSVVLAVLFSTMNLVQWKVNPKYHYYFAAATVFLLVAFVILLCIVTTNWPRTTTPSPTTCTTSAAPEVVESAKTPLPSAAPEEKSTSSSCLRVWFSTTPARGQDHSFWQALRTWDMALIVVTAMFGISGMQTAMDNLGQIAASLPGYQEGTIPMLVYLANISSYAGRVLGGFGSEYAVAHFRLPRPLGLTMTLLLACVGHLLIAYGVPYGLYPASIFIGFSLGAQWPLIFAIVSELFGLKNFSTIYNSVPMATIPGCYILNVLVTGHLYDHEAHRQGTGGQCAGLNCFKMSFLIITIATLISLLASLGLVSRTSNFYRGDQDGSAAAVIMLTSKDGDSIQLQHA